MGQGQLSGISVRDSQKQDSDKHGGANDRQIKVEIPSPRYIRSETTADERAGHRGNVEEGTESQA